MAIVGNPAFKTLEDMKNALYNNILLAKVLTRWWNFSKYTAIGISDWNTQVVSFIGIKVDG